jgi:predicted transcriptional regulator
MAKSNIVRRKQGRPRTGATPTVTIRLPAAVITGLDALAKVGGKSRTDVMREILEQALDAQPKAKKPK